MAITAEQKQDIIQKALKAGPKLETVEHQAKIKASLMNSPTYKCSAEEAQQMLDEILKAYHEEINAAQMAGLDEFGQRGTSVATLIGELATQMEKMILSNVMDKANKLCGEQHKRKLTYLDFAVCYYVHRMNLLNNSDHSSPIKGIRCYSEKLVERQNILEVPLSDFHASLMLKVFADTQLTIKTQQSSHADKKAAKYQILEHPFLDTLWVKWTTPGPLVL